jgi:hypothetical protein
MNTATEISTLAYLGYVLESSGFATRLETRDGLEELWVVAGGEPGAELSVRLLLADALAAQLAQAAQKSLPTSYGTLLQLTLWVLPELPNAPDLAHLLNVVNQGLPFGVLSHTAADGLHLRHGFFLPAEQPEPRLIAEMIAALGWLGVKYRDLFTRWQAGTLSTPALKEEL